MYTFGNHRYDGNIKDGLPDGRGTMYWADKSVYEGEWAEGKMNGEGIMTRPDGNRRQGRWVNGQMTGPGEIRYPDGRVYRGEIVDGLRHGHGQLHHPGGEWFDGEFINDRITENGTYYDASGRPRSAAEQRAALRPGWTKVFWTRTWRLWAALGWFAAAVVVGILVATFFSGNGGNHIRVSAVIAPLFAAYYGLKSLVGFFTHLNDPIVEE